MMAHRSQKTMSTELQRLSKMAKEDPKRQFFSIAHFLTPEALEEAYKKLRKKASAGIDGVTYQDYGRKLRENIQDLHRRVKSKQYRAQPLRRVYIPKEGGRVRPIGVPAMEDKVVQKAMVMLLNAIYEEDFLECSYGFRPGRSQHDALDEVRRVLCVRPTEWILEADIQSYFDKIVRESLMEMIEKRVTDGSILRLIRKWIKVGVIDDGRLLHQETGTGQGQVISPLLANIYLHHVLDTWFEKEVVPRLRGEANLIRFADDFIIGFQYREDAERVLQVLHKRFGRYGLTLHPEKTRLMEFGPGVWRRAQKRGGKKPDTFDFLGFTHVCTRSRRGRFTVHVRTMRTRLRRALAEVTEWCKRHRHDPVKEQAQMLSSKLRGHYQYYGRPTNYDGIMRFYQTVRGIWRKWLDRRTRGKRVTWPVYAQIEQRHPLSRPRITQSWAIARNQA